MSAADSQRLLQHIRRLAGDPSATPSDGELLRPSLDRCEESTVVIRPKKPSSLA